MSIIGTIKSLLGGASIETKPTLRLVEGLEGRWNYHLAVGEQNKALCSDERKVMFSPAPLSSWGYHSSHLPSHYCQECERLAIERNLGLPEEVRTTPSPACGADRRAAWISQADPGILPACRAPHTNKP